MKYADLGRMLIVDASALFEVVADTPLAEQIRLRMDKDADRAAPQVIDVEVLSIIRREHLRGLLDGTKAYLAVQNLRDSPIQRFGHRLLLERAWELRDNVRGWDAFYVALAESFGATLLTLDGRLGRAPGVRCEVEVMT
jgi:predicted nucleic acid-binding protein